MSRYLGGMLAPVVFRREIDGAMGRAAGAVPVTSVCVPNIGPRGVRRRVALGLTGAAATALVIALLAARHAAPWAFLAVVPFAAVASLGFYEAKEKT
jgi:hypothetical protein